MDRRDDRRACKGARFSFVITCEKDIYINMFIYVDIHVYVDMHIFRYMHIYMYFYISMYKYKHERIGICLYARLCSGSGTVRALSKSKTTRCTAFIYREGYSRLSAKHISNGQRLY